MSGLVFTESLLASKISVRLIFTNLIASRRFKMVTFVEMTIIIKEILVFVTPCNTIRNDPVSEQPFTTIFEPLFERGLLCVFRDETEDRR